MVIRVEDYYSLVGNTGQFYFFAMLVIFIYLLIYEIFFSPLKDRSDILKHSLFLFIFYNILYIYYMKCRNSDIVLKFSSYIFYNVLLFIFLSLVKLIRYIILKNRD